MCKDHLSLSLVNHIIVNRYFSWTFPRFLTNFEPSVKAPRKKDGFPTFATTLNSFIKVIHSTENKAIKEGTTSVNSNHKSSHVASNFMGNVQHDFRRLCMKS